jgi:hypothetical protein
MQPPLDHATAAKRESRLLMGVAAGLGCLLLLCLVVIAVAALMAAIWTLQGRLGPGGDSAVPAGVALALAFI